MNWPNIQKTTAGALILAILLVLLPSVPLVDAASSWKPTLLVNTEAFQVIDETDSTADIKLTFGDVINKSLTYERSLGRFKFDDDLSITGTLNVTGSMSGASLKIAGATTLSGSVALESSLTGSTINGFGLPAGGCSNATNSKLLWDFSTGKFSCGTDQGGGGGGISQTAGDERYVNQSGDTMTGTLHFRPTAGSLAIGLNVAATMSGRSLQVTGTGSKPILFTNVTRGFVGIGTNNPEKQLTLSGGTFLQIAGGTPATMSGIDLGANVNNVYVSGNFAYVATSANASNGELRTIDITNPSAPGIVGSYETAQDTSAVFVSTKHVFVGLSGATTGSGLLILDNTNPALQRMVSRLNFGSAVKSIYVSGKYAFVGLATKLSNICSSSTLIFTGCDFVVVDFSTPNAPTVIGGLRFGADVNAIYIQNRFAYVGVSTVGGNDFNIVDLTNPSAPLTVGGLDYSNSVTSLYASGKFTFIGLAADGANPEFRVVDTTNKTAPVQFGSLEVGASVESISVLGDWGRIGLTSGAGDDYWTLDMRNPSAPKKVGGVDFASDVNSLFISGKFAYVGLNSVAGNDMRIVDLNGIEAPAASIGSIAAGNLIVSDNARFDNNVYVRNALNVGRGGIISKGPLSIQSVGTGSVRAGTGITMSAFEVRNSTGQLLMNVTDDGRIFAGVPYAGTSTGAMEVMSNQVIGRRQGWIYPILTSATTTTAVGMTNPSVIASTVAVAKTLTNTRPHIMWQAPNTLNNGYGISGTYTETRPTYRPRLSTMMMTSTGTTNVRFWNAIAESVMTAVVPSLTSAASTVDYYGIAFQGGVNSTQWMCCSGDGTNHSCMNMGVPVNTNTEYLLDVDASQVGKLICRITTGTKTYTTIKTSNISTTNTTLGLHIAGTVLAAGNNCRSFYFAKATLSNN